MIFKRRDPKPTLRAIAEFLWPRGGWTRAFHYVKHRMRRLPDSPERIARGIWAGVFVTFTPLFGFHFVFAALLARLMKGNIVASLMATFVGNPLTFVFIALASLKTGHWVLGTEMTEGELRSLSRKFGDAGSDLWQNALAIFTDARVDWSGLAIFSRDVFYPYLIGGIVPGMICASAAYYLCVPVLRAYQKRRRGMIKAKFEAMKAKAAAKAEGKRKEPARRSSKPPAG
ncbi:DUF2062 domain-containing protein [Sulfitobacter sp. TSTF-M16]|uniref:DUF2062 domain-containing protein n=1 Tax=Sulfitobacter aestuariivivens TaxID=2766981 RepID=A0A927D431_9RHOB|nr:DUF2062 domain-containing protein [Sulfitobacter aestuariivivens]MBD3664609.1 DUF2062 domain-containing protein [Sulfitobacter aestuariivivens]